MARNPRGPTTGVAWRLAVTGKNFYFMCALLPSKGLKVFIEDAWATNARGLHSRAVGTDMVGIHYPMYSRIYNM